MELLLLFYCSFGHLTLSQSTYYLSVSGTDSSDCLTPTTPCNSLNHVASLNPGSPKSVLVSPGTYEPQSFTLENWDSLNVEGPSSDTGEDFPIINICETAQTVVHIKPQSSTLIEVSLTSLLWMLSPKETVYLASNLILVEPSDTLVSPPIPTIRLNEIMFVSQASADGKVLQLQNSLIAITYGNLIMSAVYFSHITTTAIGAAVSFHAVSDESLTIRDCQFEQCKGLKGGALYLSLRSASQFVLTTDDVVFKQCVAASAGHSLFVVCTEEVLAQVKSTIQKYGSDPLYCPGDFIGAIDESDDSTYTPLLEIDESEGIFYLDSERGQDDAECGPLPAVSCRTFAQVITNVQSNGGYAIQASSGAFEGLETDLTVVESFSITGTSNIETTISFTALEGATAAFIVKRDQSLRLLRMLATSHSNLEEEEEGEIGLPPATTLVVANLSLLLISAQNGDGEGKIYNHHLFLVQDGGTLILSNVIVTMSQDTDELTASPLPKSVINAEEGRLLLTQTYFYSITLTSDPLLLITPTEDCFLMDDIVLFESITRLAGSGSIISITDAESVDLQLTNAAFLSCQCPAGYGGALYIVTAAAQSISIDFDSLYWEQCKAKDNKGNFMAIASKNPSVFTDDPWLDQLELALANYGQQAEAEFWLLYLAADGTVSSDSTLLDLSPDPVYVGNYGDGGSNCGDTKLVCLSVQEALSSTLYQPEKLVCVIPATVPFASSPLSFTANAPIIQGVSAPDGDVPSTLLLSSLGAASVVAIGGGEDSCQLALSSLKFIFSPKGKENVQRTMEGNIIEIKQKGTLAITAVIVQSTQAVTFMQSFIAAQAGRLLLESSAFHDIVLTDKPLLDISTNEDSFHMESTIIFHNIIRQSGSGAVFSLTILTQDACVDLANGYYSGCSSSGEGGAIYLSFQQSPRNFTIVPSSFGVEAPNAVASFVYMECTSAAWENREFYLPAFRNLALQREYENNLFVVKYDDETEQMYDFLNLIYVGTASDADTSSSCGLRSLPCATITDATETTVFVQSESYRIALSAGAHKQENSPLLFSGDVDLFGIGDEMESNIVLVRAFASAVAGREYHFCVDGIEHELSIYRLTFKLTSTEESPLLYPVIRASSEAHLLIETTLFEGVDTPQQPLQSSLIHTLDGLLTMDDVSFRTISLDAVPLLAPRSAALSTSHYVYFTNIVRNSGNGSVLNMDMADVTNAVMINQWSFIDCTVSNGFGGALYFSLGTTTSLSIGDRAVDDSTGKRYASTSFLRCKAAKQTAGGYGGAVCIAIPDDFTGSVYFYSTFEECSADESATAVYVQCKFTTPPPLSCFSTILKGYSRTNNMFVLGFKETAASTKDTLKNFFDGVPERIIVNPSGGSTLTCGFAADSADDSKEPCASLYDALTTFGGVGTVIQVESGTYPSPDSAYSLSDTITITGSDSPIQILKPLGATILNCLSFSTVQISGIQFALTLDSQYSDFLFYVQQCSSLTLDSVSIFPKEERRNANLVFSRPLIICDNGECHLKGVNIRDIELTTEPLLCLIHRSALSIEKNDQRTSVFERIRRESGNGSVIELFVSQFVPVSISQALFKDCTTTYGIGGAVYLKIDENPTQFILQDVQFQLSDEQADSLNDVPYMYVETNIEDFFKTYSSIFNSIAKNSKNGDSYIKLREGGQSHPPSYYQVPNESSSNPDDDSGFPVGWIIGITLGSTVLIILVVLCFCYFCNCFCFKSISKPKLFEMN